MNSMMLRYPLMKLTIGTDDARHPAHTRHILVIPIDELLKHLDVFTFVGDLVHEIPKHWIGVA